MKKDAPFSCQALEISRIDAPTTAGIRIRNEKTTDQRRASPTSSANAIVDADRERPGRTARPWRMPIRMASQTVVEARSRPLSRAKTESSRKRPVRISIDPTNRGSVFDSSVTCFNRRPTIPVGMVAAMTRMASFHDAVLCAALREKSPATSSASVLRK